MTLSEELKERDKALFVRISSLYKSVYPVIGWEEWKNQVQQDARILNPHKRFGMIWFHIPSVVAALRELDCETFQFLSKDSTIWKSFLTSRQVNINNKKTINIRGIAELKLNQIISELSKSREVQSDGNSSDGR